MQKKTLIAWLNDAHAMELELLPALRSHAYHFRDRPDAQSRIEAHVSETEQHVERMRQALKELGSSPATVNGSLASVIGTAHKISGGILAYARLKDTITDFAAEQLEIAAYTALIAAAEHIGEGEVARLCRLNRGEDEAMAEWLDAQIPIVIAQTLGERTRL
jgi:ferritin-like metal-binding protein YciE